MQQEFHKDKLVMSFKTPQEFETWLSKNHMSSPAIWLKIYKLKSGIQSITYQEALDVALCYGWIDSLVNKYDVISYLQVFGPRKLKSPWSEINKNHIARLMKEGRIKQQGLDAIAVAKKNGNWDNAYGSPTTIKVPKDLQIRLDENEKANVFFQSLSKTQQFYFIYPIITAKRPDTKEKRILAAIEKLEKNEKSA